jgi:hypothetical protein
LTKRVEILIELVETGSIHLHHTIKVHSLKKNVTANCSQSNNNLFLSGEMGIFFSLNQWQEEEMRISEMHCSLALLTLQLILNLFAICFGDD